MEDLFGAERRLGLKFPNIGDEYKGCKILGYTREQQKDMESGDPITWDDGTPKMMVVIELEVPGIIEKGDYDRFTKTWSQVEDDEGKRFLFCQGGMFTAAKNCAKETGIRIPPVGGLLDVKHTAVGKASNPKHNPPKRYEITWSVAAPEDPFAV